MKQQQNQIMADLQELIIDQPVPEYGYVNIFEASMDFEDVEALLFNKLKSSITVKTVEFKYRLHLYELSEEKDSYEDFFFYRIVYVDRYHVAVFGDSPNTMTVNVIANSGRLVTALDISTAIASAMRQRTCAVEFCGNTHKDPIRAKRSDELCGTTKRKDYVYDVVTTKFNGRHRVLEIKEYDWLSGYPLTTKRDAWMKGYKIIGKNGTEVYVGSEENGRVRWRVVDKDGFLMKTYWDSLYKEEELYIF